MNDPMKGTMTMSTRDKTCDERITSHLQSRIEDFAAFATLFDGYGGEEPNTGAASMLDIELDTDATAEDAREQALDRINDYPLAIAEQRVTRIDLSTGGPGDWIEAWRDNDGMWNKIVYHFNDWFDHAERTLEGAEYDATLRFIEALVSE